MAERQSRRQEPNTEALLNQKGLPADLNAERLVLGSIMLDDSLYSQVAAGLKPESFSIEKHRRILKRMGDLRERGMAIDYATVAQELLRNAELEACDGLGYLTSLTDGLPKVENLQSYINIVREKATLRQAIFGSQKLINRCLLGELPKDLRGNAEEILMALSESRAENEGPQRPKQIIESLPGGINEFLGPPPQGLHTGFYKFDEMTGGLHNGNLIILAARPSMGKAQPLGSKLKTPSGWIYMRDAAPGVRIASLDGQHSTITGVFPQGKKDVYVVRFADGRAVECCDEHLWQVYRRDWPTPRVIPTAKLRALLGSTRNQRRLSVDLVSGDFGHTDYLPIHPWVLGVLLGDGGLTQLGIRFTTADQEILNRIASLYPDFEMVKANGTEYDYRFQNRNPRRGKSHAILTSLKRLGLHGRDSRHKFIPTPYLTADKQARLELLRGLLDTDGTVEPSTSIRYATASKQLALDVQDLVWSLGGICKIRQRKTGHFILSIRHRYPEQLVWLPRKRNRLRKGGGRYEKNLRAVIERIDFARQEECQCIAVSHPSGLYVTDGYILTHNTAMALNIAEHAVLKLGKSAVIFSLEMSKMELLRRLVCSRSRVDSQRVRLGYLNSEERRRLAQATSELYNAPLFIDDESAATVTDVSARIRALKAIEPIGLVIIDYLQLMSSGQDFESKNQEVTYISRALKLLAKEIGVPMLVLSQLSRAPELRKGKPRPQLSDLRESGAIEQDADVVAFIFREEVYSKDREDLRGIAELILSKQRNGPVGTIDLIFLHGLTKFENRAEDVGEPAPLLKTTRGKDDAAGDYPD